MYKISIWSFHQHIGSVMLKTSEEVDALWTSWCKLRYSRDEPLGCAIIHFIN